MNDRQVEQTIRQYLPQVIHMSLATSHDNKPWVCEVHFAVDEDLNIYFRSMPSRRHSQDIAVNPYVAGNMVTQHALNQKVRGVYFEGKADRIVRPTAEHIAWKSMQERFDFGAQFLEEANTDDGHNFYKITVSDWYLFDSYTTSPSQKFHLDWKK